MYFIHLAHNYIILCDYSVSNEHFRAKYFDTNFKWFIFIYIVTISCQTFPAKNKRQEMLENLFCEESVNSLPEAYWFEVSH